jgi:hypothetical protein
MMDLLDVLLEARSVSEKTRRLDKANVLLDRYRFQMRLAKDLKILALNSVLDHPIRRSGTDWRRGTTAARIRGTPHCSGAPALQNPPRGTEDLLDTGKH